MLYEYREDTKPNEPIRDRKHRLAFGKYKGETLETIMGIDPRYLIWLVENTQIDLHSDLMDELEGDHETAIDALYGQF